MNEQLHCPWTGLPDAIPMRRLKRVVSLVNDKTADTSRNYVGLENVEPWTGRLIFGDDDQSGEGTSCMFEPGDVLFGKLRPYLAKVALAESSGRCTSELLVLRGSVLHPRFLQYVLLADPFIRSVDASTFGSKMPRADWDFIGQVFVPVPSREKQSLICSFLDRETAAIDAVVAEKERLLELLDERRQALVTQAVTKGLDASVPLKDSGVASIGHIPAHWKMRKLGHLATIVRGAAPRPAGDPLYFGGDYCPWITVGELTKDEGMFVDSTDEFLTPAGVAESRRIPPGTLLLTNSGASLGAPKISRISGCINDGSIAFLSVSPQLHREYAWLYLSSLTHGFREMTWQGWGQQNLNTGIVKATPIPLPPLPEQERIFERVQDQIAQMVEMRKCINAQLITIRERRRALVTAAVTGTLDLAREAA